MTDTPLDLSPLVDSTPGLTPEARERLASCAFEAASLKAEISELADKRGRKLGKVQAPVRAAVLGRSVGLPLFESLEVLGRARSLERLDQAIDRLAASRPEVPSA